MSDPGREAAKKTLRLCFECFIYGVFFMGAIYHIWILPYRLNKIKNKAIEHGAAYYHPETKAFTWKD